MNLLEVKDIKMIFGLIIKYDRALSKLVGLPYKVEYKQKGKLVVKYTDRVEDYTAMAKADPGISDFYSEPVSLTSEQQDRLNFLNSQDLDPNELVTYIKEYSSFVSLGYVDNDCQVSLLLQLREKYKDSAKISLLGALEDINKSCRQKKEANGVKFRDVVVDTDRDAQSSIASSILLLTSQNGRPAIMETVDFKCQNSQFLSKLTLDDMLEMSAVVSSYVQACYTTEARLMAYFSSLENDELLKFVMGGQSLVNEKYDEYFNITYTEMAKKSMDSVKMIKGY